VYRYSVTLTRYIIIIITAVADARERERGNRKKNEKKEKKGFSIIEFSTTPQLVSAFLRKTFLPQQNVVYVMSNFYFPFFLRKYFVFTFCVLRNSFFRCHYYYYYLHQTITQTRLSAYFCIIGIYT